MKCASHSENTDDDGCNSFWGAHLHKILEGSLGCTDADIRKKKTYSAVPVKIRILQELHILGDFLLPPSPGAPGDNILAKPEDEFVTALRARLRIPYPSLLPRFRRERGPAQQCNHQYFAGSTICGHRLVRADGTADVKGKHQQLCKVGGGVDRRHNCFRNWLCA